MATASASRSTPCRTKIAEDPYGQALRLPVRAAHQLHAGAKDFLRRHRGGGQPREHLAQGHGHAARARRQAGGLAERDRQRQRVRRPRAARPAHDPDVLRLRRPAADPAPVWPRPRHPSQRPRMGRAPCAVPAPARRAADLRSRRRHGADLVRRRGAVLSIPRRARGAQRMVAQERRGRRTPVLAGQEPAQHRRPAHRREKHRSGKSGRAPRHLARPSCLPSQQNRSN